MNRVVVLSFFGIILCCVSVAEAEQPSASASDVTLKQIMSDPDWIGRSPENPTWSDDGSTIYFQRKRKGSAVRDWYRLSDDGTDPERLSTADAIAQVPQRGDSTRNHKRIVFEKGGDLFIRHTRTGRVIQLTRTSARESSPEFLAKESRISFRRDGTLLIRDLDSGLELEPARVLTEDKPAEDADKNDTEDFLTKKEADLFHYLQWEEALTNAAREFRERREAADSSDVDEPFYLGKGQTIVSQSLSKNGRWLAVVLAKSLSSSQRGRQDKMPVWIRDDAYVQSRDVRRLVGDEAEAPHKLMLLDLRKHTTREIELTHLPDIAADRLGHLRDANSDSNESVKTPEDSDAAATPRDTSIRGVSFSSDSRHLLFQCFSTDNKDRWILSFATSELNKDDAAARVLHHRYDEAWINWRETYARWIPDSHDVCLLSEASGYSHMYLANADDGTIKQVTDGQYEVSSVSFSQDADTIYFRSNESHPGVYELNSIDRKSHASSKLTSLGGMNTFEVSPDCSRAVAVHSELNKPPELYLVNLDKNADPQRLTQTTTKAFRRINWTVPQIVEVPSRHGHPIYSRLYLPAESPNDQPRRAVVFVHGAGYLQNAHQGWSGYFREFMFHTLLTRRGYVVLDMDYRASAGYGRDWRTAIYRQMGTPELEDLEDGVEWLESQHNVDIDRIGVYGGSYGGFMTLMALFKNPDLFACGAALRPVTDWAHYNHGYTSNILNTPETDPEAYERSSPIYFAAGLSAPLLICHGMVDDNVFFKDTVRLTQKLIELHKENWNVAIYPVEAHGFRHPDSWYDEYRRILELFEQHLN